MRENARGNSENHASPSPAGVPPRGTAVALTASTASTASTTGDRLRTACTRLRRYYTRHMHFLSFPFPPAVHPREKRNFLPIQCAGRNDPVSSRGMTRADSRARPTLRRERSIFLSSYKLTVSLARQCRSVSLLDVHTSV